MTMEGMLYFRGKNPPVVPGAGLGVLENRKISCLRAKWNPGRPGRSLVTILTELSRQLFNFFRLFDRKVFNFFALTGTPFRRIQVKFRH